MRWIWSARPATPSRGNSNTPLSARYHQPRPHSPGVRLPGGSPDSPNGAKLRAEHIDSSRSTAMHPEPLAPNTASRCAGRGLDRYDPGRFLAVTRQGVSSRVRDACANSSTASVRPPVPSVVAELVTTRGDGPTVEDEPRSAGTREMSASRRSSRIPSRRPSTDARIITGVTPWSPRWLVAELLQLWAVLVQPGRCALRRRRILLIDAHALPRCRDDDSRHRMPAGWASGVRPPTIGRDCRARRGERGSTHGCGGSALDGWLLGHGVHVLRHGGQVLQEPLPGALAVEDRHVTLLDQERCPARDALRTARTSSSLDILEAP
jgi:hypothetical protein